MVDTTIRECGETFAAADSPETWSHSMSMLTLVTENLLTCAPASHIVRKLY